MRSELATDVGAACLRSSWSVADLWGRRRRGAQFLSAVRSFRCCLKAAPSRTHLDRPPESAHHFGIRSGQRKGEDRMSRRRHTEAQIMAALNRVDIWVSVFIRGAYDPS